MTALIWLASAMVMCSAAIVVLQIRNWRLARAQLARAQLAWAREHRKLHTEDRLLSDQILEAQREHAKAHGVTAAHQRQAQRPDLS